MMGTVSTNNASTVFAVWIAEPIAFNRKRYLGSSLHHCCTGSLRNSTPAFWASGVLAQKRILARLSHACTMDLTEELACVGEVRFDGSSAICFKDFLTKYGVSNQWATLL
eukprot:CAMPEP_0179088224 /NCGR_PEP_ID=MMETSP0796-20121207/40130_1 /TAXON_ID=73915 /ORGANISM="Pyrodinium bahamense, Strain pbaha01" /LENGTH=109 /DNA_ID=CAMNT_0020785749 /DNA_START=261 /DNA_END=590 /DNA_ORIENTATION=+